MQWIDDEGARPVYRVVFDAATDPGLVEETLLLAFTAVGAIVGEPAVRLDASFSAEQDGLVITFDASREIGRAVARAFIGLATHELGAEAFAVRRTLSAARAGGAA